MDREALISMAKEVWTAGDVYIGPNHESLEQFAELVRNDYSNKHAGLWLRRIDEAVKAERQECAKACELEGLNWPPSRDFTLCAAVIRARSGK
jgi:hypothetical protein